MATVHEILCRLSLEGNHSTPASAYGSVKAYNNFDAERDAINIEAAIKTKVLCMLGMTWLGTTSGRKLLQYPLTWPSLSTVNNERDDLQEESMFRLALFSYILDWNDEPSEDPCNFNLF